MPFLENMLMAYARRFPVRRGKLRLVNGFWRAVAGAPPYNRVAVLRFGGMRMPCDLNEMLQRQFYYFGTYFLEEDILRCWQGMAKDASVVFDIGANAGIFSLAALASNPAAAVHAFEPTPEIAARLRATAGMNKLDNLTVNEVAVSDCSGLARLRRWRGEDGSNEGMNFITSDVGAAGAEVVPVVKLDDYCADRGIEKIDLLKIDIQGNEPQALAGASTLLNNGRISTIFAELNWQMQGDPATRCVQLLEGAGYRFACPAAQPRWRQSGDWMKSLSDIVARLDVK